MDAASPKVSRGDVPLKLVGRSGELVETLYHAAAKDAKKFDSFVKQLEVRTGRCGQRAAGGTLCLTAVADTCCRPSRSHARAGLRQGH